jgi:hypothetical protein
MDLRYDERPGVGGQPWRDSEADQFDAEGDTARRFALVADLVTLEEAGDESGESIGVFDDRHISGARDDSRLRVRNTVGSCDGNDAVPRTGFPRGGRAPAPGANAVVCM